MPLVFLGRISREAIWPSSQVYRTNRLGNPGDDDRRRCFASQTFSGHSASYTRNPPYKVIDLLIHVIQFKQMKW